MANRTAAPLTFTITVTVDGVVTRKIALESTDLTEEQKVRFLQLTGKNLVAGDVRGSIEAEVNAESPRKCNGCSRSWA